MDILLLIVGLGLILAGANFLTDGSAALAQRFRVPEFIIGLTVVAVGTSTPELVVSVLSAIGGQSDVAIGNVVGSNIFNVFVILGVCALIRPVPLTAGNIRRDIPFGVLASLLLLAMAMDSLLCKGAADRIGRIDGVVMIGLYVALMWYTIRKTKRPEATAPAEGAKAPMAGWLMAVMIVGGLAGLVFGGEMFLRSATAIARSLGISESVIAITLVAGGTSLPELASSLVSLFKGKADMALGNVIGSNIANILLIIGAGGAFNAILKSSGLADSLAVILSNLDMHPILLAWLVALILHAAVGSATVAMMGATAIVAPMLPLYPGVSPEIIAIAIGSGAIGCTIVTDSLFWLVKQYCGASLSETFKYYTTATFIASLLALAATFLLSFII